MEEVTELPDSTQPEEEEPLSEIEQKNRQLYERAKKAEQAKKELEAELQRLKETPTDTYEEEGELTKELKTLRNQIAQMQEKAQLNDIFGKYPALSSKQDEFDSYREENPGMPLETAAKAFLVEKDLLKESAPRKGLEPARGGKRTPPTPAGMSADDVKNLRENNFKEYTRLLAEGKINIK